MYFLIDEEEAGASVIGDVIRLVRGDSLAEVAESVRVLLAWPMASDGLRYDACMIGNERAAAYGTSLNEIMGENIMAKVLPELTLEDKRSVIEMYRLMYMTLKDTPEVKKMRQAWDEAKQRGEQEGRQAGLAEGRQNGWQEGRQEGRQEGLQEGRASELKRLLGKACACARIERPIAEHLVEADVSQMQSWVDRLMAGEKIQDLVREIGP